MISERIIIAQKSDVENGQSKLKLMHNHSSNKENIYLLYSIVTNLIDKYLDIIYLGLFYG